MGKETKIGAVAIFFFLLVGISSSEELPTIVEISPPNGATGVPLDTEIVIKFNKPMDPDSILGCIIKIVPEKGEEPPDISLGSLLSLGLIKILWNENQDMLTIKLNFPLSPNSTYRVRIVKNTARDKQGNLLLLPFTESSFSTIDTIPPKFEILYEKPVAALGEFTLVVMASEPLSGIPLLDIKDPSSKSLDVRFVGRKDGGYEFRVVVDPSATPGIATVSVRGTDLSGNVGTELISGGSFTIDNVASLVVERPVDGAVVGGGTIEIIGKADPDASVMVSLNGIRSGEAKAGIKGDFVLRMDLPKEDGEYVVKVESTDPFGNIARPILRRIIVDRSSYLEIISPQSGFVTSKDRVLVEGISEPGSEIHVKLNGADIMELKAENDGSFRFEVGIGDKDGRKEISVAAIDPMGNISPPAFLFVIRDTSPPEILVELPENRAMIPGWKAEVKGKVSDLTYSKAWISPEIGDEIPLDLSLDGSFSAEIRLLPGPNKVTIRAEDSMGRKSSYSLELIAPISKGFAERISMRCLGDDSASVVLFPSSIEMDMFIVMERVHELDPEKRARLELTRPGDKRLYRIKAFDMDGKDLGSFKLGKPLRILLKAKEGEIPMIWNGTAWANAPSVFSAGILEISLSSTTDIAVVSGFEKGILVSAFPNPFSPEGDGVNDLVFFSVSTFSLPDPGYATLRIGSLSGALIREISFPIPGIWGWDGKDMEGRSIPSGPYIWVLRVGSHIRSGIILVVR